MKNNIKKRYLFTGVFIVLLSAVLFNQRQAIKNQYHNLRQPKVPVGLDFDNFATPTLPSSTYNPQPSTNYDPDLIIDKATSAKPVELKTEQPAKTLPDKINLSVPFTAQAPSGNWDLPYQEACEEAASLMVDYYLSAKNFTDAEQREKELLKIVAWENSNLRDYKDTTAQQTADLIKGYFGYNQVTLVNNPTIDQIKKYLQQGLPVIVPAAGRELHNPYFSGIGPIYHMLVIKGYTATTFITNDPGTKRGADYQYNQDVLMAAIHDWNNGDVVNGQKVVIIIQPN